MGNVESIQIASIAAEPLQPVEMASLRRGRGIAGDRYERGGGTFSHWPKDHELTLVEAEILEEEGLTFEESRRNITVRGCALNDLVGKRFRIGSVLCEGTRLCEPCAHLEKLTARPGLVQRLAGKGGLRAIILEDGIIHVGDAISTK